MFYRDAVELRTKGVPGARQMKFATWELALAWYTEKHQKGEVMCKPFVKGPFDHNEDEEELAQQFSAYLRVWFVLTALPTKLY